MRLIDPLLMEFDRECSTTRKLLERVPDEKLDWKPHEKSMTLGRLAFHLASLPHWIGGSVLLDGFDLASAAPPPPPDKASEILAAFDAAVRQAKEAMAQLDDAKAMGEWKLSKGPVTFLSMPRLALVRTILMNHSYHHRGQLSVYLRLLNVPLPPMYGPTADENPFA